MSDGITEMLRDSNMSLREAALKHREMTRSDMVNSPSHYQGKVECIDAIEAAIQGLDGMEAMCTGNAIKYLFRWKRKGGRTDLEKARWYINRILGDN